MGSTRIEKKQTKILIKRKTRIIPSIGWWLHSAKSKCGASISSSSCCSKKSVFSFIFIFYNSIAKGEEIQILDVYVRIFIFEFVKNKLNVAANFTQFVLNFLV
jgi:hypothetical protein